MNCMNCGAPIKNALICPKCGCDLGVQRKAVQLSIRYYNQGLDKAQIRDLSGAIDLLQRSLKYDKRNIDARNLLGLVYFETGEAVSALSEWILSKNIKPENNIASEYIRRLQADQNRLDVINQTIKKYNIALQCCREGNDDVAVVQLKKILLQNPQLIKAYHLLALIYINHENYEKARRYLKRAAKIDKTNSTTLRFLKEIDEQTGTTTNLDDKRHGLLHRGDKNESVKDVRKAEQFMADGDTVITPTPFHETTAFSSLLTLIIGIAIGALAIWFIAVPAVRKSVTRTADTKVLEYSTTLADQADQIDRLQTEMDASTTAVDTAQTQIDTAAATVDTYEKLMKAYNAYREQNYELGLTLIQQMDISLLSVDARAVYDSMIGDINTQMFSKYSNDGLSAYNNGDWPTAIDNLEKAKAINGDDYNVLIYLAHAYRQNGDISAAILAFQDIVNKFPNTRRAVNAQQYISKLGQGDTSQGSTFTGDEDVTAAASGDDEEEEEEEQISQDEEEEDYDEEYEEEEE